MEQFKSCANISIKLWSNQNFNYEDVSRMRFFCATFLRIGSVFLSWFFSLLFNFDFPQFLQSFNINVRYFHKYHINGVFLFCLDLCRWLDEESVTPMAYSPQHLDPETTYVLSERLHTSSSSHNRSR